MLFSTTTLLALAAAAAASPVAQVSPWQQFHDQRKCEENHFYWNAQQRCIARKEAHQSFNNEFRDFNNPASCASHGYHWDVNHGCGPLTGLANTLPRPYGPYKRDPQATPWQAFHDQRKCEENHFYWDATQRCIARKEFHQDENDAWRQWTNPESCASHGFHWDVNHGCGAATALAGSYTTPIECANHGFHWDANHGCGRLGEVPIIKRDTELSPWQQFHDQKKCEENHYYWDATQHCLERKEDHQQARQDYHQYLNQQECASHGFHWDVNHGCGPLGKREVEQWAPGPWDSWHSRDECIRHAYRWDAVSNRCADVLAANAVGDAAGAIGGAIGAGVSALTGGIANAVAGYTNEQECLAHSARWDRNHARCY